MNDQQRATSAVRGFRRPGPLGGFPGGGGPNREAMRHRRARRHAGGGRRRTPAASCAATSGPSTGSRSRPRSAPSRSGAMRSSAALLNGTSGHALDWDDTQLATSADRIFGLLTHPTVPPLVAAAGHRRAAAGVRQGVHRGVPHGLRGRVQDSPRPSVPPTTGRASHSSGTVGTFGAAIRRREAAGPRRRSESRTRWPSPASSASGIRVNFGSMTKPLHVGRASQNGVVAAELAARGFTGGGDALDPPWGFFQAFSHGEGFDADRIVGRLGDPHTIVWPGVSIKPYPCGVLGHPTMDAMRRLVMAHDVQPEAIVAIRVRAGSNILNPLRVPHRHQRARGEVLPGVHGGAPSRSGGRRASASSTTSSSRARRCRR